MTPIQTPTSTEITNPQPADHSAITKLPTFADRGAAISSRLEKIKADPKYQALPDGKKTEVRSKLYDQLVPASYAGFKLPVPDKNTWVAASGRIDTAGGTKLSDTYKQDKAANFNADANVGIAKGLDSIYMFGLKLGNNVARTMFGMEEYFTHRGDTPLQMSQRFNNQGQMKAYHQKMQAQQEKLQNYDYWLQTHPRDTKVGKLADDYGELVATLPVFEGISTARTLGMVGKAIPLTEKLAASPVGKFAAKRLINAADGYLATLTTSGGSQKEAVAGAAGFAIGAPVLEGAAKGLGAGIEKVASAPLIKKYTAEVMAMGGKPFVKDIAQSAWQEMSPLAWWLEHGKEWGVKSTNAAIDGTKLGPNLMMFPEAEGKGWFVHDEKVYRYTSKDNQQGLFDRLTKDASATRDAKDPVLGKLHNAEKATFNSISMAKFGKPMEGLTTDQRIEAMGIRAKQIEEAANEAPAHLPDDVQGERENQIKAARAANPELDAKFTAREKKYGANFAATQAASDVNAVSVDTGIKNSKGALRRVAKATKETSEGKISPQAFAQHRADTLAYFRAPRNRESLAVTLGPQGHENWAAFYEELKQHDPSQLKYEKPEHRLLFNYPDLVTKKDKYSQYLSRAIERRLKQTTEYSGATNSKLLEEGKRLQNHVYKMAKNGFLEYGSNVYRSTKLGEESAGTIWQSQQNDEVFGKTTRATEMALSRHPSALKAYQITSKTLKLLSENAKTADEAASFRRQLEDYSTDLLGSMSNFK